MQEINSASYHQAVRDSQELWRKNRGSMISKPQELPSLSTAIDKELKHTFRGLIPQTYPQVLMSWSVLKDQSQSGFRYLSGTPKRVSSHTEEYHVGLERLDEWMTDYTTDLYFRSKKPVTIFGKVIKLLEKASSSLSHGCRDLDELAVYVGSESSVERGFIEETLRTVSNLQNSESRLQRTTGIMLSSAILGGFVDRPGVTNLTVAPQVFGAVIPGVFVTPFMGDNRLEFVSGLAGIFALFTLLPTPHTAIHEAIHVYSAAHNHRGLTLTKLIKE